MTKKGFILADVILNLFQDLRRKSKKCHIDLPKRDGILRIAQNNKKCAFTLAEVLITLGVIGIVVAMTLPTVLNNSERNRNAAILMRAYSDLAKYIDAFALENNCLDNFTNCTPNDGQFVWEFSKYLYEKQKFVEMNDCRGKENCYTWVKYRKNRKTDPMQLSASYSMNSPLKGQYLLASPTGLYAYFLLVFPYDNLYNIKGDTFRARVIIMTDMKRLHPAVNNMLASFPNCVTPQNGRNMFEAYILNSRRVLPNGTSMCSKPVYYCKALDTSPTGNCSIESGDFSACMQRVMDDGWKIKYSY